MRTTDPTVKALLLDTTRKYVAEMMHLTNHILTKEQFEEVCLELSEDVDATLSWEHHMGE